VDARLAAMAALDLILREPGSEAAFSFAIRPESRSQICVNAEHANP